MKYPIEVEEKRTIKRITVGQAFADLLQAFNVERGLIYTVKLLYLNPGKLMEEYLTSGRYRIFNVFRLLILTTAVSLITFYFFGFEDFVGSFADGYTSYGEGEENTIANETFERLFTDYYNLILWIAIPCYALAMYIFFGRHDLNYAEHMVSQSFYLSGVNIIYIAFLPMNVLVSSDVFFYTAVVLSVVYFFYFFARFFKTYKFFFFIKAFFAFLLANFLYLIAVSIVFGLLLGGFVSA